MRIRHNHKMKLQPKMMISFLLLLFIPVIVIAMFGYRQYVHSVIKEVNEGQEYSLAEYGTNVTDILLQVEDMTSKIAMNPVLVNYFYDESFTDLDYIEFSRQYFANFTNWLENFGTRKTRLHFFTRNPNVFENEYVSYIPFETEQKKWYRNTVLKADKKIYWEHGVTRSEKHYVIEEDSNDKFTAYSALLPMNDSASKTIASVSIPYEEILKEHPLVEGMLWYVFDNQGALLYATGKVLNTEPMNGRIVTIEQDSYLIHQADLGDYGLHLYACYPQTLAQKSIAKVRDIFMMSLVGAVILLVFVSYMLSKSLSKRLERLAKTMHTVQKEGLEVRAIVDGTDEIGTLAQEFNEMVKKIKVLTDHYYKAEILRRDAIVKALEGKINPHFLYNSLETISMMAEIKNELDISDAVSSLGEIVRYNLSQGGDMTELGLEIEHLRSYCDIHNLMMNSRLHLNVELLDHTPTCSIMKLLLQPVVENSILHGFKDYGGICEINVRAWIEGNHIYISVKDNGNGIDKKQLEALNNHMEEEEDHMLPSSGNGMALRNVYQRIRLKYGTDYGMEIESQAGVGTKVLLILPLIR